MRNVTVRPFWVDECEPDQDSGVVLVWVALMMVVLLGIGALVIDIGRLLVEARELQNGADAASLAVAQDCAGSAGCGDKVATAEQYAEENARDKKSAVEFVCVGPSDPNCVEPSGAKNASGWVRVGTETQTETGNQIDFLLAPIMSALTGKTVQRDAVAAWGSMGAGPAVPLVFSECEYAKMGGIVGSPEFPDGINTIRFDNGDPLKEACGVEQPGGFGRVDADDPKGCIVTLKVGSKPSVDTGEEVAHDCDPASWEDEVIVIAVYGPWNESEGQGTKGSYGIVGFVGLHVLGYDLRPGNQTYSTPDCPAPKGPRISYICGRFVPVVGRGSEFGSGTNYGASIIKMVE